MKGIVFTEFLDMIESRRGTLFLQQVIEEARLPSRGAYASTGVYPHAELHALLGALSTRAGKSVGELMREFGEHLFARFSILFPGMFVRRSDAFDFLANVEREIHGEVRKLYPEAELPSVVVTERSEARITLRYASSRHLSDLCEGLISGCLRHFGEQATISRTTVQSEPVSIIDFEIARGRP